jgi:serine/threonine protein kinase
VKAPGHIIGHYEVLGQWVGGHGSPIWVARDLDEVAKVSTKASAPRLYAVRAVADASTPKSRVESIVAEAHTASLLRHPRIVRVREVIAEEDVTYVACDFVPGESLAQLLHNAGTLSRTVAAAIARQVAVVLHDAHVARDTRGAPLRTIHGDLAPASVTLTHEGDLYLTDFGVEDATSGASPSQVAYRAPERKLNASDVDHRADIYALGCVLFEMLTGEKPSDSNAIATPALKRAGGRELEAIVLGATRPTRTERYGSALEMAEALDAYLRQRASKLELKDEIEKLMARHFQNRARATRTLIARWTMQAGTQAPRRATDPPLRRTSAQTFAEPLAAHPTTAVTDDVMRHRSMDLSQHRPRSAGSIVKIAVAVIALLLLTAGAIIGIQWLHYRF